jgi:hypothetical protein
MLFGPDELPWSIFVCVFTEMFVSPRVIVLAEPAIWVIGVADVEPTFGVFEDIDIEHGHEGR